MTLPYYPFFWSDYSGKTLHLTLVEHGTYFLLLRHIYTAGAPIPHRQRYSIAKALLKRERQAVDDVLTTFFRKDGDFWFNDRALEVMAESSLKHQKRVMAGGDGGRKKASNARAMLYQPEPEPKPEKKKEEERSSNAPARDLDFMLSKICDRLGVTLTEDPSRLTWKTQLDRMLDDGLDFTKDIVPAVEIARANGKPSLSYVRTVAFNQLKERADDKPRPSDLRSSGDKSRPLSPHDKYARAAARAVGLLDGGRREATAGHAVDAGVEGSSEEGGQVLEGRVLSRG